MNLDGFHVVDSRREDDLDRDRVRGAPVAPSVIERSTLIEPGSMRSWKYADNLPSEVAHDGRLYTYFTVEEIAHTLDKSPNTIRDLARKFKWRYRKDARYNTKSYYVYDLFATVYSNLVNIPCNTLEQHLLIEAEDWQREANS